MNPENYPRLISLSFPNMKHAYPGKGGGRTPEPAQKQGLSFKNPDSKASGCAPTIWEPQEDKSMQDPWVVMYLSISLSLYFCLFIWNAYAFAKPLIISQQIISRSLTLLKPWKTHVVLPSDPEIQTDLLPSWAGWDICLIYILQKLLDYCSLLLRNLKGSFKQPEIIFCIFLTNRLLLS